MKKVLIVEDNDLNLKLFCDLLTIKECEIIVSKDGVSVVDIAATTLPDLILMDIQLNSGISGIDLISELKANEITKHIPIIAITAFAMKTDEELISKSGCDMYLSKPVSIEKFFQSIDFFINPTSRI
jgi:two-component system cell cycle response regulator DivK